MEGSPHHLVRMGIHAEQDFLIRRPNQFDYLVLNANLVRYSSKGTASLLAGPMKSRPYFIDPATHAFGHNPRYIMSERSGSKRAKVKQSWAALAEEYGEPIAAQVGNQGVSPSAFSDERSIREFAGRVISFQANHLQGALESDAKYLEEGLDAIDSPLLFVAPYFYMESDTYRSWMPVNEALVEASKEFSGKLPVFAEVVLDRGILEEESEWSEIAVRYSELGACDGFLLWISDFSEHRASRQALLALRSLVERLSESGRPVYNMYGGYFSTLLWHRGMRGVCHGPGYGEERNVIPVGGGLPYPKYYFTPLHQRLQYEDVEWMVREGYWKTAEEFHSEVCGSETCRHVIHDNLDNFSEFGKFEVRVNSRGSLYPVIEPDSRQFLIQHFMEAKSNEFETVGRSGLDSLVQQLEMAKKRFDSVSAGVPLRYLDNWIRALSG